MDLARRTLSAKAGAANLVDGLCLGDFNYVVLALNDPGGGSAEMPMVVALGIGRPLCKELDQAGSRVSADDRHRIVDRIIESWTAHQMLPVEVI